MNINSFPKDTPFVVTDDAQVQKLLLQLGIIDQFPPPSDYGAKSAIYVCDRHPTHWCLFLRYEGYAKAEDNGFVLHAAPKSLVGREIYGVMAKLLNLEIDLANHIPERDEMPEN